MVGPAGGNYGLRIQADKNVKKLTVKYANKIPVNKNKTRAHSTILYTVAFESISISSYDFPLKKGEKIGTHIHLSYVLSAETPRQDVTGGERHMRRQESKRHLEQGDQGRADVRWR